MQSDRVGVQIMSAHPITSGKKKKNNLLVGYNAITEKTTDPTIREGFVI